jgi:hypothetical protein
MPRFGTRSCPSRRMRAYTAQTLGMPRARSRYTTCRRPTTAPEMPTWYAVTTSAADVRVSPWPLRRPDSRLVARATLPLSARSSSLYDASPSGSSGMAPRAARRCLHLATRSSGLRRRDLLSADSTSERGPPTKSLHLDGCCDHRENPRLPGETRGGQETGRRGFGSQARVDDAARGASMLVRHRHNGVHVRTCCR